jgi:hypothetical protein
MWLAIHEGLGCIKFGSTRLGLSSSFTGGFDLTSVKLVNQEIGIINRNGKSPTCGGIPDIYIVTIVSGSPTTAHFWINRRHTFLLSSTSIG